MMLWARLLGLVNAVVEGVEFDETEGCVVVLVRPRNGGQDKVRALWESMPGL